MYQLLPFLKLGMSLPQIRVRLAAFVKINQEASNEPESARVRAWEVHFRIFAHRDDGLTIIQGGGRIRVYISGMRARIRVRLAAFVRINQEASNETTSARVRPWQVHFQDLEHTLGFTLPEGP